MAKQKANNHIAEESLNQLADRLVGEAQKIMRTARFFREGDFLVQ